MALPGTPLRLGGTRGLWHRQEHIQAPAAADACLSARSYGSTQVALRRKGGHGSAAAKLVGEFLGTYMLAFVFTCCDPVGTAMWNSTAMAAVTIACAYSIGPVSGGHFNPAITLAFGFCNKLSWPEVFTYVCAQMLGALSAVLSCTMLFQPVVLRPLPPYGYTEAAAVEFIYTAMLCFVSLSCTACLRNNPPGDENNFFGLAIGMVYIAGGYPARKISGACFNVAISLSIEFSDLAQKDGWHRFLTLDFLHSGFVYSASQASAAFAASVFFVVCRPEEFFGRVEEITPDSYHSRTSTRLLAEAFGTFAIAVTAGLNFAVASGAAAWSMGAATIAITYSLWDVSGAHFNPANTFAAMLSGRRHMSAERTILASWGYIIFQLLGGLLAGVVVSELTSHTAQTTAIQARSAIAQSNSSLVPSGTDIVDFTMAPNNGHSWNEVGVGEFMFTAGYAFAFLSALTSKRIASGSRQRFEFALAVGGAVIAGSMALTAVSGGYLNPAIAAAAWTNESWGMLRERGLLAALFGRVPGTSEQISALHAFPVQLAAECYHWLAYAGSEFAGGMLAAIVFFILRPDQYKYRFAVPASDTRLHSLNSQRSLHFEESPMNKRRFAGTFSAEGLAMPLGEASPGHDDSLAARMALMLQGDQESSDSEQSSAATSLADAPGRFSPFRPGSGLP